MKHISFQGLVIIYRLAGGRRSLVVPQLNFACYPLGLCSILMLPHPPPHPPTFLESQFSIVPPLIVCLWRLIPLPFTLKNMWVPQIPPPHPSEEKWLFLRLQFHKLPRTFILSFLSVWYNCHWLEGKSLWSLKRSKVTKLLLKKL